PPSIQDRVPVPVWTPDRCLGNLPLRSTTGRLRALRRSHSPFRCEPAWLPLFLRGRPPANLPHPAPPAPGRRFAHPGIVQRVPPASRRSSSSSIRHVFSRDPTVSDEIVLAMGRKAERVPGTTANRVDPVAERLSAHLDPLRSGNHHPVRHSWTESTVEPNRQEPSRSQDLAGSNRTSELPRT